MLLAAFGLLNPLLAAFIHVGSELVFILNSAHHAVLDIDVHSQYHDPRALSRLLANLNSVGLQSRIYQSSQSGGWHIYLPFDCWAQSDEVELTLKWWLKAHDYEIASGQLVVFASGNALRLPLQPAS